MRLHLCAATLKPETPTCIFPMNLCCIGLADAFIDGFIFIGIEVSLSDASTASELNLFSPKGKSKKVFFEMCSAETDVFHKARNRKMNLVSGFYQSVERHTKMKNFLLLVHDSSGGFRSKICTWIS